MVQYVSRTDTMEKMMSMLLMLLVLSLFISSSQADAVTCYKCDGTPECGDPFTPINSTCIGEFCTKGKDKDTSKIGRQCNVVSLSFMTTFNPPIASVFLI